jgi:hypothetical protein
MTQAKVGDVASLSFCQRSTRTRTNRRCDGALRGTVISEWRRDKGHHLVLYGSWRRKGHWLIEYEDGMTLSDGSGEDRSDLFRNLRK